MIALKTVIIDKLVREITISKTFVKQFRNVKGLQKLVSQHRAYIRFLTNLKSDIVRGVYNYRP